MIIIKNLNKSYGNVNAVKNLNVEVKDSSILAFIGHNGAGKTTILNIMTGILSASSGEIYLNGKTIKDKDYKKEFTYVFDTPDSFLYLKAFEYFEFLLDIYENDKSNIEDKINELAEEFEIKDKLNDRIDSLSHGTRQKVMIIGALLVNPKIWILDEPLTGLDPVAAYKLKQKMLEHKNKGNIVIFSTHILEVAEKLCDSIVIIKKGEAIFKGSIEEIKEKYPLMNLENIFLELMGVDYNEK